MDFKTRQVSNIFHKSSYRILKTQQDILRKNKKNFAKKTS